MPFVGAAVLLVGDEPDEWILDAPLCYITRRSNVIVIPRGFVTDLASIPRVLYVAIPVNGRHRRAAILHDWLYEKQPMDREQCDQLFLEAMEDCGVGWLLRQAMYAGVRIGGWLPWGRRKHAVQ